MHFMSQFSFVARLYCTVFGSSNYQKPSRVYWMALGNHEQPSEIFYHSFIARYEGGLENKGAKNVWYSLFFQ